MGRLRDQLVQAFGADDVFLDVYSLELGKDFRLRVRDAIEQVSVLVLLIGPGFGLDKLQRPDDYVRMELEAALTVGTTIIPVLIDDSPMPSADDLPQSLRPIAFLNAGRIRRDPDFPVDAERLLTSIRAVIRPPEQQMVAAPAGAERTQLDLNVVPRTLAKLQRDIARALAYTPDGSTLVSAADALQIWDVESGSPLNRLSSVFRVRSLAFSPDGAYLAAVGGSVHDYDHHVTVWSTSSWEQRQIDVGATATAVAFSREGVLGVLGGSLALVDVESGRVLSSSDNPYGPVSIYPSDIVFADTDTVIFTWNSTLCRWHPNDNRMFSIPTNRPVTSLSFAPGKGLLAGASVDGTTRIWELSLEPVGELAKTQQAVNAVALSPDASILAAGGQDGLVRLWNPESRTCLAVLRSHRNQVYSVAFAPDGRALASAGGGSVFRGDNQVRLWSVADAIIGEVAPAS